MRGLVMALLAIDFPGHGGSHRAGRAAASVLSDPIGAFTTTKATITKTTAKTV